MQRPLLSVLAATALLTACGHTGPTTAAMRSQSALAVKDEADLAQIRQLATAGMQAADAQPDWDNRFLATNHALGQIGDVKLDGDTPTNLVARLGLLSASGYGYIGFHPQAESKYKVQLVVLQYLAASQSENTLAKGAGIFTMADGMLRAAVGYSDGVKVGISVLTGIRDYYADKSVSQSAAKVLQTAHAASDLPGCFQAMLDGIDALGKAVTTPAASGQRAGVTLPVVATTP